MSVPVLFEERLDGRSASLRALLRFEGSQHGPRKLEIEGEQALLPLIIKGSEVS